MNRLFVTTVCLVLLSAASARAQSPLAPDTWTVSPAVGVAFDPDADISPAVGVGVAFPLTDALAAEGEFGHLFDMASDDADVDSSLTTVHAALLYFFDNAFVATPYVAAGLGLGKFSHDVVRPPASIEQTEIGFNLGGGLTYLLGERVWLRGDFRYFKHIDNVPSAWRLLGGVTVRFDR
jgi:opacity protein-like surface antigen